MYIFTHDSKIFNFILVNVIDEIIKEQQPKSIASNWLGFSESPTTYEEALQAVHKIPKKFRYKVRGVPAKRPIQEKGVPTELSESMGLLSGSIARQLANYLKRFYFREVVYVSSKTDSASCTRKWCFCVSLASDTQNPVFRCNSRKLHKYK